MTLISKTYEINAPINIVWDALTNPETINKWGAGPNAIMTDKVGEKFELWDKSVFGINTEVVTNKKLVQDWFGGKWDKPSQVTFELSETDGVTEVKLTQENMPEDEAKDLAEGWDEYYMGKITELLERKA